MQNTTPWNNFVYIPGGKEAERICIQVIKRKKPDLTRIKNRYVCLFHEIATKDEK